MYKHLIALSLSVVLPLFTGCAGSKTADAVPAPATKTVAARPTVPAAHTNVVVAKSTFTMDQTSRDPFFPQARKVASASNALAASAPVDNAPDMSALLSSGLQGIGGTGDRRMAVIHNVILEIGRSAVIPVTSGSNSRTLPVRCRDITRDTVVLDVEGYGQVVVTRKQML